MLGRYDYCHTIEGIYISWYSARLAFRQSYKEILHSTTFLETNLYDSNTKKYELPLVCMKEGKLEEAKQIFMHTKKALKAVESRYKNGAVFRKRLLPYKIEKNNRVREL